MTPRIWRTTLCAVFCALGASSISAQIVGEILAQPQQQLEATGAIDMGMDTAFGEAVAIDGDMLVVGSPHESYLDDREGAIYVFERNHETWSQTQRIVSPDGDVRGQFGTGVDISLGSEGISFIVVGAPFAGSAGKVYTFKREGGGLFEYDDTLLLFEPDSAAQFGVDVGVDFFIPPASQTGDPAFVVAVGAPSDRESIPSGNHHGSVSIFQYVGSPQSWVNTDIFYGANGGRMGTSVAVAGPAIVAGSIGANDAVFGGGAAFLYTQGNQLPGGAFAYNPGPRLEVDQALVGEGLGNASAADWESGLAAVGAVAHNSEGFGTGAVYVFDIAAVGGLVRTEIQMLQPDAITGGDQFGASVSLTETLLAVGAPGVFPNGEVYLFERPAVDWEVGGRIIPDLGPGTNLCQAGVGSAVHGRSAAAGCPGGGGDPFVLVHDGNPIFTDGFESGDTSVWSSTL